MHSCWHLFVHFCTDFGTHFAYVQLHGHSFWILALILALSFHICTRVGTRFAYLHLSGHSFVRICIYLGAHLCIYALILAFIWHICTHAGTHFAYVHLFRHSFVHMCTYLGTHFAYLPSFWHSYCISALTLALTLLFCTHAFSSHLHCDTCTHFVVCNFFFLISALILVCAKFQESLFGVDVVRAV